MKNGEEKKNVIYPSKWLMINHETKSNFINRYDGAYFIICGVVSYLTGLDFDNLTISFLLTNFICKLNILIIKLISIFIY